MSDYVGRFAPSPTGPLHFGSLLAALASYLDARHKGGRWLLRIEDLDPPRESAQAPGQIIEQLQALSLDWDGDILYQSQRLAAYDTTLLKLEHMGLTYRCSCSRKSYGSVYPGTCRDKHLDASTPSAIRFRVPTATLAFSDQVYGEHTYRLQDEVGDFIVLRKDGYHAYQLAVVVDDVHQGVNHVVRGADLLDSTPRQLALYHALGQQPPGYLHIPLAIDHAGAKLSKQTHAEPISTSEPVGTLRRALSMLGQDPHPGAASPQELLRDATRSWNPTRIPRTNMPV